MPRNHVKKEILYKLNQVWLVQWITYARDEKKFLSQFGIKDKYDIINIRKDFDHYIIDYAKDIYKLFMLSFSEKAQLAEYSKGKKNRDNFFGSNIPVFTHYHSNLYNNLIKCLEAEGLDSKKYKLLVKKWGNHPQYILVGHNPAIEIIKVFNFVLSNDSNGKEVIEWDRPLENGKIKKESYIK